MDAAAADPEQAARSLTRRVEAANLTAWPAARLVHDGAWLLRRTPGHGSKRLNCLTFLDPADDADAARRLQAAFADFAREGLPPVVRITPLTPPGVVAHLDAQGFERFDETRTMILDLDRLAGAPLANVEVLDEGPRETWAAAMKRTGSAKADDLGALVALLERIVPESALSVAFDRHTGKVAATTLAVADRGLVGLFDVGTVRALRRRGHARAAVAGALAWGRARGAGLGYLQVLADNPAVALYERFGFRDLYRGDYRRPAT
jgi:ribosomal protein S18 acetylase RimI-like enzyme